MADSETKEILTANSKEYFKNAVEAEKRKEFNTAITLFFKTLASLVDLYIYVKKEIVPSSHSERFRILEREFPEIYVKIDRDFSFYQDSYKSKTSKESCEVIKNDAKELFKLLEIGF